jgi:hypothetical protein
VRNYRSHPDLLTLPSTLFYGGRLVACADPVVTHSVLQSGFELPNQRWARPVGHQLTKQRLHAISTYSRRPVSAHAARACFEAVDAL